MTPILRAALCLCLAAVPFAATRAADEPVLNLYSARHYQTDEALYDNFTKSTGIKIKRIEAGDDQLLERLRNEGANSPADVLLIVDAARLSQAEQLALFQPIRSKLLDERIPASMRDPEGDWFGFSSRGRVLIHNKSMVNAADVASYASLADPKLKGKVCTRSGSHPYNLSLIASRIAHVGEAKAEEWAKGVVANLARKPQGGDTDQIKAVAAGECAVAISNTYYYARLLRSTKPEDKDIVQKTGVVWPDQSASGTHINISGGGVLKNAPHRDNAIRFLEYLASDQAQIYFADGNNEWPAVKSVKLKNPALDAMGSFKADPLSIADLGKNTAAAQKIADRVGWR
ncbi:MAG TPA: Fe(3+) ABC transporter substrate-binding protein [Casimicrobiaceae bacterium]|nr:Fe(3+) ABC transporter substrate-binding protein [Casimicrobiaceae bacterium]